MPGWLSPFRWHMKWDAVLSKVLVCFMYISIYNVYIHVLYQCGNKVFFVYRHTKYSNKLSRRFEQRHVGDMIMCQGQTFYFCTRDILKKILQGHTCSDTVQLSVVSIFNKCTAVILFAVLFFLFSRTFNKLIKFYNI